MINTNKNTVKKSLIMTLALIYAVSPFAIDSYLPAVSTIANELHVNIAMLSVTVSLYIFGLAIGQLIGGPLSDKHGRLPIIILGLSLFAGASLLLASSTSITAIWGWRIVQAIAGGMSIVGIPAIIRENAEGKDAAKLFALVSLILMIAPSIAPTIGNFILSHQSWHWIFYFMSTVALLAMLMAIKFIPHEKKTKLEKKAFKQNNSIRFIDVFKEKRAIGYMVAQGFAFAVMMTYVANSAMVYMGIFEVTTATFSKLFALNIFGLIIINRVNHFLLNRFEPETLLRSFLTMQVLGGILLVASSLLTPKSLPLTVAAFVITLSANGGIIANSNACFLKYFSKGAGTASAVLGAFQCVMGAAISALAAFISMGKLQPVVMLMLLSSSIALLAVIHSNKKAKLALEEDNRVSVEAELLVTSSEAA